MEIEMKHRSKKSGFSLTEVLIAVGILAVAMLFIAGVFPVAIRFSTIATERTIAAIIADEAFAKLRLYALGNDTVKPIQFSVLKYNELMPDENTGVDFDDILPAIDDSPSNEFLYPTSEDVADPDKQYCWSALFRLTENDTSDANSPVQVTVFVCRRSGKAMKYRTTDGSDDSDWPVPVKVEVSSGGDDNELRITNSDQKEYISDGYTIVDDATGRIYRVLERYKKDFDEIILLDRDWNDEDWQGNSNSPDNVWVVPPGVGGSRGPCIAVYQKVMIF